MARVVFEAEASGGSKAGGLPHPSLFPFPPLPLSIPPKFSDKPVGGGRSDPMRGKFPGFPPTNSILTMAITHVTIRPLGSELIRVTWETVATTILLRFDCNFTAVRPFDDYVTTVALCAGCCCTEA